MYKYMDQRRFVDSCTNCRCFLHDTAPDSLQNFYFFSHLSFPIYLPLYIFIYVFIYLSLTNPKGLFWISPHFWSQWRARAGRGKFTSIRRGDSTQLLFLSHSLSSPCRLFPHLNKSSLPKSFSSCCSPTTLYSFRLFHSRIWHSFCSLSLSLSLCDQVSSSRSPVPHSFFFSLFLSPSTVSWIRMWSRI